MHHQSLFLKRSFILSAVLLVGLSCGALQAQVAIKPKTENIVFVMTDGLRWQELFRGADPALMNKESGVGDLDALKKQFWRDSIEERRKALMPFLWTEIAGKGQIFGNRDKGSNMSVTNGFNFSYPGYNETLTGFADPRIDSNKKVPNPNVTVLEWLNKNPKYKGKVAAFGAWDVISAAVNGERGGFVANAGYDPLLAAPVTDKIATINKLKAETVVWGDEPFDSFAFQTAMEYVKLHKPRVLYISLGETDDWAHDGKYELYLKSANRVDQYLKQVWDTLQAMPQYKGKTTMIFSPDHGRGEAPTEWKGHGQRIPDSKYIWAAFMGPDTPVMGERSNIPELTQSQLAATLAALLGEDYASAEKRAGRPIQDVLPH